MTERGISSCFEINSTSMNLNIVLQYSSTADVSRHVDSGGHIGIGNATSNVN